MLHSCLNHCTVTTLHHACRQLAQEVRLKIFISIRRSNSNYTLSYTAINRHSFHKKPTKYAYAIFHHSPLHLDAIPTTATPTAATTPPRTPPSANDAPINTTRAQRVTIPLAEVSVC